MKNVHRKGPSLYYVKHNRWVRLGPATMTQEEINGAVWRLKNKGSDTLEAVMRDYEKHRLPKRSAATQKEYSRIIKRRLIPTFGHMRPDDVSPQDIAVYLERRESRDGKGPAGNREISCLSSVFNHGMRIRACKMNPCYGVRRNEEHPRTYYVTDAELRTALRAAPPALRYMLWATYLTGFRQGDLRRLTMADLCPDGVKVRQSKDGKHEIREWTDSLRKVVRRALERSECDLVFTNAYGRGWTLDGIGTAMQRLKERTGAKWTFHDLRAKAESDHETGLGLMRRYNRARKLKAVR